MVSHTLSLEVEKKRVTLDILEGKSELHECQRPLPLHHPQTLSESEEELEVQ